MSQSPDKLGVIYEPESVDVMSLAGAVAGRWPLVWLLDGRTPQTGRRLLSRFGEVVDVGGDADRGAAELAAAGVGGLTAFSDGCLTSLAEIGARLGVAVNSERTTRCWVDKLAQRRALEDLTPGAPRFCAVEPGLSSELISARLARLTPPLVIKPALRTGGSRRVRAVVGVEEAAAEIQLRHAEADPELLIVEECLGSFPPRDRDGLGDYVSVELVSHQGRHHVIAVTGRTPLAAPFRETGSFIPALLEPREQEAVETLARAAADALGVTVGCQHVEIKLTGDGPRIIEVNGRNGGGGIPQILRDVGAADPLLCAATVAMGRDPRPLPRPQASPIGYAFAIQPPLDRSARLREGWRDRVAELPGINRLELRRESGTATEHEGSYGYLALVGGLAPDRGALLDTFAALNALVEVA